MADKEFLQKLLVTFRAEAEEHLQHIAQNIMLLEQTGQRVEKEVLERQLRTLHTLKGAARVVDLPSLENLCHAMESVFSAARQAECQFDPGEMDLLHQAVDLARMLCNESSGRLRNQVAGATTRLDQLTARLMAGRTVPAVAVSWNAGPASDHPVPPEMPTSEMPTSVQAMAEPAADAFKTIRPDFIRVQGKSLDAIRYQVESLLSVDLGLQHHIAELIGLAEDMANGRGQPRVTESQSRRTRMAEATGQDDDDACRQDFQLRCQQLASSLGRTQKNFAAIRSQLMEATLETALVPFSSVLEPLPSMVRNLARNRGKNVNLNLQDEEIHIDRRVIDIMRDALMHVVTNAVDHGIEMPAERLAQGKSAVGEIRINVTQRGSSQVSVIVADDGAGIDVAALTKAALKAGELNEDKLVGLSDRQKLRLVFLAGVSTSPRLTSTSGRGVGLSAVADKVASVGGELTVSSVAGSGCSFELLLPVRLATLRGLVLRAAGATYVLPLSGIEAVRAVKGGDIQTVENRKTLLFNGRVLRAVRLCEVLNTGAATASPDEESGTAVISRADGKTFALLVDEVIGEQEVLPKNLGKLLRRVRFIMGATQLGDGSLVPVLGMEDLARHGLAATDSARLATRPPAETATAKRLLVVEDSITSRLLLKHILEGAGYRVETAADGLEALSRLRQENFHGVVSDVEMPNMDGLELTTRIRSNPKTEGIPVILVTSLQSVEEKERGLRAGADAYLVKGSFEQDNLLKSIRRLL